MKSSAGLLIVISGFSGAGKGTLIRRLLEDYPNYALSISMTTRPPREGEQNGREYFFATKDQFEQKIQEQGFIEYASYCDHYYGTPKDYVESKLTEGKDVILEIEIQGAMQIKEKYPESVLLFIMPPTAESLRNRLIGRGTESEGVIEKRLRRASQEAVGIEGYDYLVVNDDLDQCVRELHQLLQDSHLAYVKEYAPAQQKELIEQVSKALREMVKGEK